jgi:hypothetical protein
MSQAYIQPDGAITLEPETLPPDAPGSLFIRADKIESIGYVPRRGAEPVISSRGNTFWPVDSLIRSDAQRPSAFVQNVAAALNKKYSGKLPRRTIIEKDLRLLGQEKRFCISGIGGTFGLTVLIEAITFARS